MKSKLFAIVGPEGDINHTKIGLNPDDIIEEFLEEEQTLNIISNAGRIRRGESLRCSESWESYEAQGYKVLPVTISLEQ